MAEINDKLRVGVIGLGSAGHAMVKALSAKHELSIFDRDAGKYKKFDEELSSTVNIAKSAGELAASAQVIIFCLPTPEASLSVAQSIKDVIRAGSWVVESSTVRPEDIDALQNVLSPSGVSVIDAAIIGGVHNLEAGNGVFLVGAIEGAAGEVGRMLQGISAEIFFLERQGDGMRAKLVANAVSHTAYVLLLEAGALAASQNIPMSTFVRLMERESGLLRPLTHRFAGRLKQKDFSGGMSTTNAHKDSALILETARDLGVPLFAIPATHVAYDLAIAEGFGSLDYAAIGKLWERWLDISYFPDESE